MRYVAVVFSICLIISVASLSYAELRIDYYCKTECLGRGGTMGYCNSLCAMTDSSGNPSENTDCVSSCLNETGWTRYNCYRECQSKEDQDE